MLGIDVDGIHMHYVQQGRRDPVVVLVHGIPTGATLWRKVMPLLTGVRAIAWEMVGYGKSVCEGRHRDISVAAQAGYLRSFLRALRIHRAILVGHDLGGGVVQIAAVRDPSVCAGLLLANSICYDSWPVPALKTVAALRPVVQRMPKAVVERVFLSAAQLGHDDRDTGRESSRLHWACYEECDSAAALVRQARALDVRDTLVVQDRLRTLRGIPARVVWGSADPYQKLRYAERLACDLDAPLQVIHGGRHFTPEDHPEVLAGAILGLCEEVSRHGRPNTTSAE